MVNKVWPGWFKAESFQPATLGSPGKVKRLLTHAEIADIQTYADRYVGYRLEYMKS